MQQNNIMLTGLRLLLIFVLLSIIGCSKTAEERKLEILSARIASAPNDVKAINRRGVLYEKLGQYEKAVADYSRAITLVPDASNYYFNRGNALSAIKKYTNAIADYDSAIQLNAKDSDYFANRGLAEKELKHFDKAIENYNAAIWLDDQVADYYLLRSAVYTLQNKQDLAAQDVTTAKELQAKY